MQNNCTILILGSGTRKAENHYGAQSQEEKIKLAFSTILKSPLPPCVCVTQARVGVLTGELQDLRSQLEDARGAHERQLQSLGEARADLQSRSDAALREVGTTQADEPGNRALHHNHGSSGPRKLKT